MFATLGSCASADLTDINEVSEPSRITNYILKDRSGIESINYKEITGDKITYDYNTQKLEIEDDSIVVNLKDLTSSNANIGSVNKNWSDPINNCRLIVHADKFIDWMGDRGVGAQFCTLKIYIEGGKIAIYLHGNKYSSSGSISLIGQPQCVLDAVQEVLMEDPTEALEVICDN